MEFETKEQLVDHMDDQHGIALTGYSTLEAYQRVHERDHYWYDETSGAFAGFIKHAHENLYCGEPEDVAYEDIDEHSQ